MKIRSKWLMTFAVLILLFSILIGYGGNSGAATHSALVAIFFLVWSTFEE